MSVASHSSNKLFQKVTLIKIIVITHHIPTQLCTAAEFQNSTINGAFTIELGTFIAIKSRAFATSIWSFYGYMKLNITNIMFFPIDNITLLPFGANFANTHKHHVYRPYIGRCTRWVISFPGRYSHQGRCPWLTGYRPFRALPVGAP